MCYGAYNLPGQQVRTGLTDAPAKAAETGLMADYTNSDIEDENGQHWKQPIVLEEFKPAELHTPIPTAKQSNSRHCQTTKVQQQANKCICKTHQTNKPPAKYQWQQYLANDNSHSNTG